MKSSKRQSVNHHNPAIFITNIFTNYTIPGKKQKQINPPYPFKNSQKKKKISPSLEKRRRKHRTRADFIRLECQQSLAATQECVCQIRRGISMASRCSAAAERRVCTRGRERVRGKRRQREGSVIGETWHRVVSRTATHREMEGEGGRRAGRLHTRVLFRVASRRDITRRHNIRTHATTVTPAARVSCGICSVPGGRGG